VGIGVPVGLGVEVGLDTGTEGFSVNFNLLAVIGSATATSSTTWLLVNTTLNSVELFNVAELVAILNRAKSITPEGTLTPGETAITKTTDPEVLASFTVLFLITREKLPETVAISLNLIFAFSNVVSTLTNAALLVTVSIFKVKVRSPENVAWLGSKLKVTTDCWACVRIEVGFNTNRTPTANPATIPAIPNITNTLFCLLRIGNYQFS
jgi:hypothetical protein